MARPDPHSAFDPTQPRVRHIDWRARIDFAARVIVGDVRLRLEGDGDVVDLDTRDLSIDAVTDDAGAPLAVEHGAPHPVLGQRLRIAFPRGAAAIRVRYRTSPQSIALHWSNQSVYSQCQPIYARALVPLPDSPSSRLTVRATVTAPRALVTLMSGAFVARREDGDDATTTYEMVEPIPPYLLALAVGEYGARELSPRSRVWAAPARLDAAARRFADVERMLVAAEALLGRYRWRRFDLLIAPASFPYGGMENPRLAFLSPTLLDEATTPTVLLHELAHAWSGNLVTAASAEHFWLNEAFTVWAERRVLAAVEGAEAAARHEARGRRELERAIAAFSATPALTRLRTRLDGLDPDAALSIVPYEKGYLLLRALERDLGVDAFAALVRDWLARFAWQAVTTEEFHAFAAAHAPAFPFGEWFDQSGLPESAPPPPASPPDATPIDRLCAAIAAGTAAPSDVERALAVGRVQHVRAVYLALATNRATRDLAGQLYRRFRDGYHPISRQQIERLFREVGVSTQDVKPLSLGRRT